VIKSFLAFLGGEPGEEKPMLLLLGMGFFMGIFIATYQIGSETLFLDVLGEPYLDIAFFTTGALGIISTVLFVYLQRRINYSTLIITNLFLIFFFMAGMRAAFEWTHYDGDAGGFQILPFIMFVMIGPILAITLLGFWGIFGRVFDLRASKRIIGGIDTGALTATIIAFFSIPFITQLPFINSTYDLLFVSALASFGVLFFTVWIVKDFNVNKATKVEVGEEKPKEVRFLDLIKDPYLRLLSLFLIFSMGASVFVNYTFYSATEIMYPDEQELTNFLSFFSGTVMILSFLIQSFVNDIIIGRFGLKVALMTMPLILILFTLGGIVSGHIFGYEVKTQEYILFFMFTACAKAFTASLKDALENPAFKLLFLPIDIKIRFDIQTRIEGVVNELATLIAGATQIGLGALVFFKLIHFSYFVLGLAGMVVYLSGKLFNQYKQTLRVTLKEQKKAIRGDAVDDDNTIQVIKREMSSKNPDKVINSLRMFEKLEPIQFEFALLDQLNSRHASVRRYAYTKLDEYLVFEALDIIKRDFKTEGDPEVLPVAEQCIANLEDADQFELNDISIRKLVRSTEASDRVRGARLLVKSTDDKHLPYLLELLRDINPKVKSAAMTTAGKVRRPEIWPTLVENLHLSTYGNVAMSSLSHSGEAAFHAIDTSFYKTGQFKATMLRIVQLLGRIGGRSATDLLWKKIDFPDKKIVSEILKSLSYTNFRAKDFQAARIKIAVESEIGDIAWNIKAVLDIPKEDEIDIMMREAFREEDKQNYANIFMLLSMIYDPENVQLVRENIQDGTTESITFAVEMLDIFVEDELKPKLIPVMDELKIDDRLAKLQQYYPPEDFESYSDLLLQIINRDYNRINRYTKALAIYRIGRMEGSEVSQDLIANLFNPDRLLLETAANTIYKIDQTSYHIHTKRLKPGIKKELDKAILPPVFQEEDEDYHQKLLLIERVLLLKEVLEFKKVPGELITYIAEELDEIRLSEGNTLVDEGDEGAIPMYVIVEGKVDVYRNDQLVEARGRGGLIGHELLLPTSKFDYTALTRNQCTLLVLRKEELLDLMSKHIEIVEAYLSILNREEVQEEDEVEIADILLS